MPGRGVMPPKYPLGGEERVSGKVFLPKDPGLIHAGDGVLKIDANQIFFENIV